MTEKRLTKTARKLRNEMTDAERQLWSHLRASQFEGVKFTRQFPIGGHIVDFACRSLKLVIECDGGQHSDDVADVKRTRVIEEHGYRVIRFWNNDVLSNPEGVLEVIKREIDLARNN